MKISAISDIHYPENESQLEKVAREISDSNVLVIAGDISSDVLDYGKVLREFKGFEGAKIAVLGNHDLYVGEKGDSIKKMKTLSGICERNGFHLLDDSPVIIGRVGFVGNIGWYDYQFAQRECEEKVCFFNNGSQRDIKVSEMTDEDFKVKVYRFCTNGRKYEMSWADVKYIKWNYDDKEFLELQLEKLQKNLEDVSPKVNGIVYVSHHIPIWNFIYQKPRNPEWSVFNAYQGSPRLGEVALSCPKLSAIICGHSHIPNQARVGNVACYDVSRDFGELKATEIVMG